MPRQCLVIRVFTRDGGGGNHLGIVTDLDGLDTAAMQQIATNLGFSETIFIDMATPVPVTRIFTPGMELPFAGHPLVGAAWFMGHLGADVDRLVCGIGEVAIRNEGHLSWVDIPMKVDNAHPDSTEFATAVAVPGPLSTWRVETPLDYRMVELATAEAVANVNPNTDVFGAVHGLTVYARAGDAVRMRFFIPVAGINEDPATGSAAVALATMYAARGEPAGELAINQGEEIGHPSRINLRWTDSTASIGGTIIEDGHRTLEI